LKSFWFLVSGFWFLVSGFWFEEFNACGVPASFLAVTVQCLRRSRLRVQLDLV
jgi:hypothetical protein